MFLHVGADVVVSMKRVIAILDLRSTQGAEATREFLSLAHGEKRVIDVSGGDNKSFVVTPTELYLSPISSMTLRKRADFLSHHVIMDFSA